MKGQWDYIIMRFIYFQDRSAYSAAGNIWTDPGIYKNRWQTHECGWDWGCTVNQKQYINGIFFAVYRQHPCGTLCKYVHNITLPQITENQKEFPRGKIVDALKEAKDHSAEPISQGRGTFCPSPMLVFYFPSCSKTFPDFSRDYFVKKKSVSWKRSISRPYDYWSCPVPL